MVVRGVGEATEHKCVSYGVTMLIVWRADQVAVEGAVEEVTGLEEVTVAVEVAEAQYGSRLIISLCRKAE
jgi:hypothetical protein